MPEAAVQVEEPPTSARQRAPSATPVVTARQIHREEPDPSTQDEGQEAASEDEDNKDDFEWIEKSPDPADASPNGKLWQIYVEKAGEHDRALFKRWNEEIDVFLIFTGLFSAVLSAFLIFSLTNLQPDSGQGTADALAAISAQLVIMSGGTLNTTSAYQSQPLQPLSTAVAVNVLWFISLFVSLLAAVTAMLVKEWLREYDEHVSPVPRERVYQRQLRFECLNVWLVPSIVAILPLLVHVAVFLFFVGLVLLANTLNALLCWTLLGMLLISLALYLGSSIAPLVWMDSPYKSPLFKALQRVMQAAFPVYVPPWRLIRTLDEMEKIGRAGSPEGEQETDMDDLERGFGTKESQTLSGESPGEGVIEGRPAQRGTTTKETPTLYHSLGAARLGALVRDQRGEKCLLKKVQERLNVHVFSWLMTHPDPSIRDATLYFLGWHRLPEWLLHNDPLLEQVSGAAISYVEQHQLANTDEDLESLAIISCLTRDLEIYPSVNRFWDLHANQLRSESLPNTYEDNLVALVAANLRVRGKPTKILRYGQKVGVISRKRRSVLQTVRGHQVRP